MRVFMQLIGMVGIFLVMGVMPVEVCSATEAGQESVRLQEFAATLEDRQEQLRLLELDVQQARLELELSKLKSGTESSDPEVLSAELTEGHKPDRPQPVLRQTLVSDRGRLAYVAMGESLLKLEEGDKVQDFRVLRISAGQLVLESSKGQQLTLKVRP